jgi:hypothetical protein
MMVLRIFKAVWFLSLLACVAVFMYFYAGLGESVLLAPGEEEVSISREAFFYLMLTILGVFNAAVFVFTRLSSKDEVFLTWFFGLIISFNLFSVILLYIINLFNNGERFDYGRLDFVVYGSVGLLVLWTLAWPVIKMIRKLSLNR